MRKVGLILIWMVAALGLAAEESSDQNAQGSTERGVKVEASDKVVYPQAADVLNPVAEKKNEPESTAADKALADKTKQAGGPEAKTEAAEEKAGTAAVPADPMSVPAAPEKGWYLQLTLPEEEARAAAERLVMELPKLRFFAQNWGGKTLLFAGPILASELGAALKTAAAAGFKDAALRRL